MSKIETNAVRTNINENFCAHKKLLSPSDWSSTTTHDKYRGRVIAFARLIDTSFQKIFTNSCAQLCWRWLHPEHQIETIKYFISGINRFDFNRRIVSHSLILITNHVCALSICRRLTGYQDKYCGITNITVFKHPNY